jgi:uncharacterized repeat protein (TIGR01451 family)
MKRKFTNIFIRVPIALIMAVSLIAALGAPISAEDPPQQKTMDVDVSAWVKLDDGSIHPLLTCLPPCQDFLINAAITAAQGTCTNVEACITIRGPAHLVPCETECKSLGIIQACSVQDVWWKLHCDEPGPVEITVNVTATDAQPASDTTWVYQCLPQPCPVLQVEMIECAGQDCPCPDCDETGIYVEVSEVFGVKARISFARCPRSVQNVVAKINIAGPAELVEGMPDHWDLGDMDPGDSHEVGWTVHCAGPGNACITVDVDFDGEGPGEVIPDECRVHQEVPACLMVNIATPRPGEKICAGCEDIYQVCAVVANPCDVDAENVIIKLSASGGGTVQILDTLTKIVGDLPAGASFPWCWRYKCTGVGDVTFTVSATGTEKGTNRDLNHSASVTIQQVPFIVKITAPAPGTTFSTCQNFLVAADIRNCCGDDLDNVEVTLSWDPPAGASWVGGAPPSQVIELLCLCEARHFEWMLHCDAPGPLTLTLTIVDDCCGTYTHSVRVNQELKAHLVGGLETYYQCCDCDIMEPIRAFDPGQIFHVVAPICNAGQADAVNVMVGIDVGPGAVIVGGANPQTIPRIPGGECRKAYWLVKCEREDDVNIRIVGLGGIDENTLAPVLEDNICWCCPITVKQIPVDIEFIQPYDSQEIPPCEFFTVKAKICNQDTNDTLHGVNARLYWKGNAELADGQPNPVPVEDLLPGECAEATWEMHCTDWGDVSFSACVRVDDPGMCFAEPGPTMHQDVPDTCLCVDILSPEMGSIYATSQEFAVTATIRNTREFTAYDVVTSIWGYGFDVVACAGCPPSPQTSIDLGDIEPFGSKTVTWTVHCNDPGLTLIMVGVKAWNIAEDCLPGFLTDMVAVWQYPAAHLEVEVLDVKPDTTITVCEEFDVLFKVTNTGEADATEVELVLSVTPEGSARPVAGIDNGYTKYIGTLPGHGQDGTCEGVWKLHCKEACESTINITATGLDEYGYHKKQQCQSSGNFIIEKGCEVVEGLDESVPTDNKGWFKGFFIGEASGLSGPFSIDTPVSWAKEGGGPDFTGRVVAMGVVMPDIPPRIANLLPVVKCGCLDDWQCQSKDLMLFVGHIVTDTGFDALPDWQVFCVDDGLINIINGVVTGAYYKHYLIEQPEPEPPIEEVWIKSLLGGTYCSVLAAESLRPINDNFIEDAWVTVKQLPSSADLAIQKVADQDSIHIGDPVVFTITLSNNGPSNATSIMVKDLLPAGIDYTMSTASQGWYDVISGLWDVGDLAKGGSAVLTIEAAVNVMGEVCNRATIVTADQHDPVTGNNSSVACVTGHASNPHGNIPLDAGYNLISPPIIPKDPASATMMGELDFIQVAMYKADGSPSVEDWFFYNKVGPSDLTSINDGYGYWINMNTTGELVYEGYSVAPPPPAMPPYYDVVPGWNLIGFTSIVPKPPTEYLASIAGQYGPIYGFDNGMYFIVGTPGHQYLQIGYGYWIAIFQAGTIYP